MLCLHLLGASHVIHLYIRPVIKTISESLNLCAQTVRVFSLKGMTSKLFGQESQEQRDSRLAALEQSIREGEAALKERNTECL